MIRTTIIPNTQKVSITVPKKYIGKKIEILMYATDEEMTEEEAGIKKNAADFKGLFSKEEGKKFNQYIKQARSEWDRNS